jgi:hypothetical protein
MRTYHSYNELKNNTLKNGDLIDFGLDHCRKYSVCTNFLENLHFDGQNFNNDYIFRVLKVNKVDLAKKCYKNIETLHEDRPLFPECKVDGENYQSLTNITLELFKIKENLENIWQD